MQGSFKEVSEGGLRSRWKGRGDGGGHKEGEGGGLAENFLAERSRVYSENQIFQLRTNHLFFTSPTAGESPPSCPHLLFFGNSSFFSRASPPPELSEGCKIFSPDSEAGSLDPTVLLLEQGHPLLSSQSSPFLLLLHRVIEGKLRDHFQTQ